MGVVRAENSDHSENVVRAENSDHSENDIKIQKRTKNSSKIHTPLAQGLVWMVMLMEWMGRPFQLRRKPPKSGQKFATPQIHTSSIWLKPHPPDQPPHTALMAVNKATLSYWFYPPCFLHYRLNSYSKFQ